MIPKAPTAHFSNAPPVNMLYMSSKPPPSLLRAACLKKSARAAPSSPGTGNIAMMRQIPKRRRVKRMRDLSYGILKQLAKVFMMVLIMRQVFEEAARVFHPHQGRGDGGPFSQARGPCHSAWPRHF